MNLRVRQMVPVVASPSSPASAGKEKDAETGECRAVATSLLLGGSAETAALEEETEVDAGVDGYFWTA